MSFRAAAPSRTDNSYRSPYTAPNADTVCPATFSGYVNTGIELAWVPPLTVDEAGPDDVLAVELECFDPPPQPATPTATISTKTTATP